MDGWWQLIVATATWLQESAKCHGKLVVAGAPLFQPANSLSSTTENSGEEDAGVVIERDF